MTLVLDIEREELTQTPKTEYFIRKQTADNFCRQMVQTVRRPYSAYSYDKYGFLVRRAHFDVLIHYFVPKTLQATMLYFSHYSIMAGHPGSRGFYDTMGAYLYWPHMPNGFYATFKDCCSCAANKVSMYENQKHLRLFTPIVLLSFVAMDVSGSLPKAN